MNRIPIGLKKCLALTLSLALILGLSTNGFGFGVHVFAEDLEDGHGEIILLPLEEQIEEDEDPAPSPITLEDEDDQDATLPPALGDEDEDDDNDDTTPGSGTLPGGEGDIPDNATLPGDDDDANPGNGTLPAEEEEDEKEEDEKEPALFFDFDGDLYISPLMYREAVENDALYALFMDGVRVTDQDDRRLFVAWIDSYGGFDPIAGPDAEFTVVYAANHPETGETFKAERTAVLIEDEEPAQEITFTIDGDLTVEMIELHAQTDINAILLRGVRAVDENGEEVAVTALSDGGFEAYVKENFAHIDPPGEGSGLGLGLLSGLEAFAELGEQFVRFVLGEEEEEAPAEETAEEEAPAFAFTSQVVYAALHPESGEEFTSDPRDLFVSYMQIAQADLGPVMTFVELEARLAGFVPGSENVIEIGQNIQFTHTLVINGKTVTIRPAASLSGTGGVFLFSRQDGAGRHFDIRNGGTLILEGVGDPVVGNNNNTTTIPITLHGQPGGTSWTGFTGGVEIESGGTLEMRLGASINNNRQRSGGGVHVRQGGTFNLVAGNIHRNTAELGGGVYVDGGVFNIGDAPAGEGRMAHNTATDGGAIYLTNGGTLTMNDGTIGAGSSSASGGNTASRNGGAIFVGNGAKANITSTGHGIPGIQGNEAGANGGAVAVVGSGSTLTMDHGDFWQNHARNGNGGGVWLDDGAGFTMSPATAGRFTRDYPRIDGSTAATTFANVSGRLLGAGGGVFVGRDSGFTMTGGLIRNNRAVRNAGFTQSNPGNITGGGGGVLVAATASRFEMIGGAIKGNTAQGGLGGGVSFAPRTSPATFTIGGDAQISENKAIGGSYGNGANVSVSGGGVALNANVTVDMSGSARIEKNNVTHGGGGGGAFIDFSSVLNMSGDSTIVGNSSSGFGGGVYTGGELFMSGNSSITGNSAQTWGGGIYAAGGSVTMRGTASIDNNKTTGATSYGGGLVSAEMEFTLDMYDQSSIWGNQAVTFSGGANFIRSTVTLNDSASIKDNRAGTSQGGISVSLDSELIMNDDAEIVGNKAGTSVGGVSVSGSGSSLTMNDRASINGNSAATHTGGVWVASDATLTMESDDASISYNGSNTNAGGVWVNNGRFNMNGGKVSYNVVANGNGGGVYVSPNGVFNLTSGEVSYNQVTSGNGGGVFIEGARANVDLTGGLIERNKATRGGGLYLSGNVTVLEVGTIQYNTARQGGGIFANGTLGTNNAANTGLRRGRIEGNEATQQGGGIYFAPAGTQRLRIDGAAPNEPDREDQSVQIIRNTVNGQTGVYGNRNLPQSTAAQHARFENERFFNRAQATNVLMVNDYEGKNPIAGPITSGYMDERAESGGNIYANRVDILRANVVGNYTQAGTETLTVIIEIEAPKGMGNTELTATFPNDQFPTGVEIAEIKLDASHLNGPDQTGLASETRLDVPRAGSVWIEVDLDDRFTWHSIYRENTARTRTHLFVDRIPLDDHSADIAGVIRYRIHVIPKSQPSVRVLSAEDIFFGTHSVTPAAERFVLGGPNTVTDPNARTSTDPTTVQFEVFSGDLPNWQMRVSAESITGDLLASRMQVGTLDIFQAETPVLLSKSSANALQTFDWTDLINGGVAVQTKHGDMLTGTLQAELIWEVVAQ